MAVLISQLEGGKLVLLLAHRIGLNDCAEDRKAILDVQGGIIAVAVYPCTHRQILESLYLSIPRLSAYYCKRENWFIVFMMALQNGRVSQKSAVLPARPS